ncbi:MAG: aspartate aminotransferase family protein [Solitalea-like symbiont of Tyrophagus putrescentiae]
MDRFEKLKGLFNKNLAQTSTNPLKLGFNRAEGIYLYDFHDNKYIDLISGISVSNFGHSNPSIKQAIKDQVDAFTHLMVYGEYITSPQTLLSEKILSTINKTECAIQQSQKLDNIYFVNSGSEAIEGALKIAKKFTGRNEIIALNNSYHGSTHGALSILGSSSYRQHFEPLLPNIKFINLNKEAELSQITKQTACVIIEIIQSEAGVITADQSYIELLNKRCKETGALLIIDEVQTGMYRTGTFCAFEHYNVQPDILVLAKGIGAGMPLGAFISSTNIMSCIKESPPLGHITTFGGHPVSCAASLAAFNLIDYNFTKSIVSKSELFKKLLKHNKIKEVRGMGLLLAVDFDDTQLNMNVINRCINKNIIVDWFLHNDKTMRIAPPLIITEDEIKNVCATIISILNAI